MSLDLGIVILGRRITFRAWLETLVKITGIELKRFLSFGHLNWSELDPGLNVIVGPNGVGKTNLFHSLRAVVDALDSGDGFRARSLDRDKWESAVHQSPSSSTDGFEIAINLCLTSEWEKRLVHAFICAVLSDPEEIQSVLSRVEPRVNASREGAERLAVYVQQAVGIGDLEWLYQGRLVVRYEGDHRWHTTYESLPGGPVPFCWEIEGSGTYGLRGPAAEPGAGWTSLFESWRSGLSSDDQARLDRFLGDSSEAAPTIDPRRVVSEASRPINLYAKRPGSGPLSSHKLLENLTGITLEPNRSYGGPSLFRQILERGFVFTENVRRSPQFSFTMDEITNPAPVDLSSGEGLALELFRLKNGDQAARARYKAVQRAFTSFTRRTFEVGIGSRVVPAVENSVSSDSEKPRLPLVLRVTSGGREVPLGFAGAGIAETLYLSTLLEGVEDRVVLLDEPAANLHRDVQAGLLRELESTGSRSQLLIVSHSPTFVTPNLEQLSRFYQQDGRTIRAAVDQTNEEFSKLNDTFHRFVRLRELLFSRGVILVEGEADLIAYGSWLQSQLRDWDVQLYAADADTAFANHILYLRSFAIPRAVVCDGKVIGERGACRIALQLRRAGVSSPDIEAIKKLGFKERRDILEEYGVFTLAKRATDELEHLCRYEKYADEAEAAFGPKWREDDKPRLARFIVDKDPSCPDEVRQKFLQAVQFLRGNGTNGEVEK